MRTCPQCKTSLYNCDKRCYLCDHIIAPEQSARSGEWLGELEAALRHAKAGQDRSPHDIRRPVIMEMGEAIEAIRIALDSVRRHSQNISDQRCRDGGTSAEIVRVQQVVRELAKTWERRLAEGSGPTDNAWTAAKTIQLRECCDELRAVIEKLPNGLLSDGGGQAS